MMNQAVGNKWSKRLATILIVLIAAVTVIPFLWTIMLSFKTNQQIMLQPLALPERVSFENYINALKTLPFLKMYWNTLVNIVVVETITLAAIFSSSFAIARIPFKSRRMNRTLYTFLLSGLMIPAYILVFPVYKVNFSIGLLGTRMSLLLPLIATNISYDTLLFVGAMKTLPSEVEESAIIDGCSIPRLCVQIIAPMMTPTLICVIVFNVLYVWNEYVFSSLFITKPELMTLSMGMSMFQGLYSMDYAGMIAATVMLMIPQLLFYTLFQRQIINGMTAGAVKG